MLDLFQSLDIKLFAPIAIILFMAMNYRGTPLWVQSIFFTICLLYFKPTSTVLAIFILCNIILVVRPIRRNLFTFFIMKFIKKLGALPKISETEEIALRAGNSWIESDLFSGTPDFKKIFAESYPKLSAVERKFINNQVNHICNMVDDWQASIDRDLTPEVWEYLKKEKFFGMIIPKKYGGLQFSALGHSAVVSILATRSQLLAITTMVPNSLGPAELLLNYGTDKQKEYYLPRLADGRDIPCFALTEPLAGSDATSIKSEGVIFKDAKGKIKIRLNFRKRYITLGAVANLIGLAFQARDPENLLNKGEHLGITCALIKRNTKGIDINMRHDPLNVSFVNAPIAGKDVVIDIDDVIGGADNVGFGWKMLMECLSVGRGISLPATSTGGAKLVTKVVGNYALIRRQFGLPIGKFEGIQEPMAEIAGFTYMLEAARVFTAGAIDNGYKPAVTNAIAKYHFTEKFREIINHGMDILGGAAICRGPRNLLSSPYMGSPISITVEGANIMTRSLIHFGQGAIRCHPYSYDEMKALMADDVKKFDYYFFKHVGHLIKNKTRSIILSLSRGRIHSPTHAGLLGRYEQKLAWASSSFALYADIALALYGGNIKRKEQINGRFGDILSAMYFATSLMRRYIAEGQKSEDRDYFKWGMEYCFAMMQDGFSALFKNLSPNLLGIFIRYIGGFYNRLNPIGSYPSDKLSQKIATTLIDGSKSRDNLTADVFVAKDKNDALAKLEICYRDSLKGDVIMKKIKQAIANKTLDKNAVNILRDALQAKIITSKEKLFLDQLQKLQEDVVEVDSFLIKDYLNHYQK